MRLSERTDAERYLSRARLEISLMRRHPTRRPVRALEMLALAADALTADAERRASRVTYVVTGYGAGRAHISASASDILAVLCGRDLRDGLTRISEAELFARFPHTLKCARCLARLADAERRP